ncbi:MBL fold metallo-hydrolase [Aquimarina intermedia]|uniref:Glyoxylase-like metal-dependent hydrolase (Beta-lactamase superfamily II) n=1 Tax=Aquimarina intermedia TaxID=350814 RepID=A0A5S5C9N6_9FLAO|nr:MBL fold metallo-hydrolase [Aquimarina intermedia]TYP76017.1 glyoxylase-like metal-dependent hydrolase (beta-lactamase superfamily II) [Aquimarina intermedia]
MITGQEGNIGVLNDEKGLFIIDNQFARLSEKILRSLKSISNQPVTMVVNTHFQRDHTGGNENMTRQGATIFAQKNVRTRLQSAQQEKQLNTPLVLPIITFDQGLQLYFDKEAIQVYHVDQAHTDGDALVYFTKGNVLHMGDTFFNGKYPYIDLKSGGTIKGYIKASERALLLINDYTKIIPGHGKLAQKKDLETFLDMLKVLSSKIRKEIKTGKTQEQIIKDTSITAKYDAKGYGDGFINSERIRTTIYNSLHSEN